MIRICLSIGLIYIVAISWAQEEKVDSVLSLPSFMVTAERVEGWAVGQKTGRLDRIHYQPLQSLNLGQVMAASSSIQINTYSYNGLSTISFRGTSSSHTGIFWHGIPLNQVTNGILDLSLFQAGMFDKIRVLYGGGSSLLGSGMIGGSIHLGSEPYFNPELEVKAGLFGGSFGTLGGSTGIKYSSGRWYLRTHLIVKKAENNFSFTDLSGEKQRLANARQEQEGILQDIYYRTRNDWIMGTSLWYQQNDKEIPATLTSKPSDAFQLDRSFRGLLSLKKQLKKGDLWVKTALLKEQSRYQDPDPVESVALSAEISTDSWISDITLNHSLGKFLVFRSGGRYNYTEARSDSYGALQTQHQSALYASLAAIIPSIDWKFNVNLRQEWVDNFAVPFTPSLGAEGRIYKFVSTKAVISKNFRVPTLNDRYWIPGGNPELQPETSWNEEVSLIFNLEMPKMRNRTRMIFTAFNANVDQWILWLPEGTFWTAQNVQKVWSRGVEVEYQSSFQLGPARIVFNGGYSFTRSTNEAKTSENDQSFQKQLIYVPEQRYFFTGKILFKGLRLAYNQSYTGLRYSTRDNSESLPPYSLGNLFLGKNFIRNHHSVDVGLTVSNLWDKTYQSVQYNPMPGRHFEINLLYKFNKPIK